MRKPTDMIPIKKGSLAEPFYYWRTLGARRGSDFLIIPHLALFVKQIYAQFKKNFFPKFFIFLFYPLKSVDKSFQIVYNKGTKNKERGKPMKKAIYFDMDGTIADLYAVKGWLKKLRAYDETPYENANTLVNMSLLARYLNRLQKQGYTIGIVSWLSKNSSLDYDRKVKKAKIKWLAKHLKSVEFDEINIVAYGTPKSTVVSIANGILFDDEEPNRSEWKGKAYDEKNIIEVLKALL